MDCEIWEKLQHWPAQILYLKFRRCPEGNTDTSPNKNLEIRGTLLPSCGQTATLHYEENTAVWGEETENPITSHNLFCKLLPLFDKMQYSEKNEKQNDGIHKKIKPKQQ